MRNIIAACAVALLIAAATPVAAQVSDNLKLTYDVVQTERKALVAEAMDLSPAETKGFWPVYDAYQTAMAPLTAKMVSLLLDYVEHRGSFSDEKAADVLQQILELRRKTVDTQQSFVEKFSQVVPPRKVLRFYQIENRLDLALELQISRELPLSQ